MPTKNVVKQYSAFSYYHVYNRGVNKQLIFRDEADYAMFTGLFKRYLSKKIAISSTRHKYKSFSDELKLLSYALMPNHIHLFIYQAEDPHSIAKFMQSIMTSYSIYFNKKYQRRGPLFGSKYLGSLITSEDYYIHISRYIHLNPKNWRQNKHTSIDFYSGNRKCNWLDTQTIFSLFESPKEYMKFLEDYQGQKNIIDELKWELASPVDQ